MFNATYTCVFLCTKRPADYELAYAPSFSSFFVGQTTNSLLPLLSLPTDVKTFLRLLFLSPFLTFLRFSIIYLNAFYIYAPPWGR